MTQDPILVVEDDDDLRHLLRMVCNLNGISAIFVPDAASALEAIAKRNVSVILTDLNLGGDHDGLAVLSAGVAGGHPVVVMSASVAVEDATLMGMGATRVMAKPFDVVSLPAVIAEARDA